jgi:hypothetical protein
VIGAVIPMPTPHSPTSNRNRRLEVAADGVAPPAGIPTTVAPPLFLAAGQVVAERPITPGPPSLAQVSAHAPAGIARITPSTTAIDDRYGRPPSTTAMDDGVQRRRKKIVMQL